MARTRFIKPGFFDNEVLASLSPHCRLLFIGLWTIADRDGKLDDRPPRIKAKLFPYEEVNVEEMLQVLDQHGFILRYEVQEVRYILIPMFKKHQSPHPKEQRSTIPEPITCHRQVIGKPMTSTGISGTSQAFTPSIFQSFNGESVASHRQASDKPMTLEESPMEWLSKVLSDRHPKKGDRNIVPAAIIDQLGPLSDDEQWARAKQIDKTHAAWCRTSGWTKQNGTYAPKLTNWLREGGWRDEPPLIVDSGDMPDTDVYDKGWREERGL